MRKFVLLGLAALALAAVAAGTAAADDDGGKRTWKITITNLTPTGPGAPGSQPLSPPLFVVHSTKADVWSTDEIASHGVAAIAEDANNGPLESALPGVKGVRSATTGAGGPIPSGATRSYTVETSGPADRLSILAMLVNTNDGFTGLDSVHLRGNGATYMSMAYDAGSEQNNELGTHIPGPCCGNPFVRAPEGALIGPHGGITGVGDLGPEYDWDGAAARIVVERLP